VIDLRTAANQGIVRLQSAVCHHFRQFRIPNATTLGLSRLTYVERSGPNLKPGTMRVYVTDGPRNVLNIGRKVGPCPGCRRRWVLGSVRAFSQALHAANTYRPRFQVRTRPSYSLCNPRVIDLRTSANQGSFRLQSAVCHHFRQFRSCNANSLV